MFVGSFFLFKKQLNQIRGIKLHYVLIDEEDDGNQLKNEQKN